MTAYRSEAKILRRRAAIHHIPICLLYVRSFRCPPYLRHLPRLVVQKSLTLNLRASVNVATVSVLRLDSPVLHFGSAFILKILESDKPMLGGLYIHTFYYMHILILEFSPHLQLALILGTTFDLRFQISLRCSKFHFNLICEASSFWRSISKKN